MAEQENEYDVLETEKNHMINETIVPGDDDTALINDNLGVAPDAGVDELDPDPLTDKKMIEEDDE